MLRFVRIRKSHARRFVPGSNERQLRNARAKVSWTRSSASSRVGARRLRHPVDLVGQLERLLFEAHALERLPGKPPSALRLPCLTHQRGRYHPSAKRHGRAVYSRPVRWGRGLLAGRRAKSGAGQRREMVSRSSCSSFQVSMTCPMRFAFAASRPSRPCNAPPSRMTHRSQRMPVTWTVSDRIATRAWYRRPRAATAERGVGRRPGRWVSGPVSLPAERGIDKRFGSCPQGGRAVGSSPREVGRRALQPVGVSGRRPSSTEIVSFSPSRKTSSSIVSPGFIRSTASRNSSTVAIGRPSTAVITSPPST